MSMSFIFGVWLCLHATLQPTTTSARLKPQEHLANLQRTAAACDDTIDVYRLGMIEIVAAAQLVVSSGQPSTATPESPVPEQARQTFSRLAQSIAHRVDKDALNALFRAYHYEIIDALERLGHAKQLGQILEPAEALLHALDEQSQLSAHIQDIYARQRPFIDNIISPNDAFNQINDALDQLALAEQNIDNIKRTHGSSGQLFQAFLRLEITLGHALDLIAAADNVGMEMGLEPAANTHVFSEHLDALRTHIRALHACIERMRQRPVEPALSLHARWHQSEDAKKPSYAEITWVPPAPGAAHAARQLRLSRKLDVETARKMLIERQACQLAEDQDLAIPVDRAIASWAGADPNTSQAIALLPPGRSGYQDTQLAMASLPWEYRLASVNAFGVEHPGAWQKLEFVAPQLQPPYNIHATAIDVEADSELFYHDAGSVRITWQASQSDLVAATTLKKFAQQQHLPIVARYAVFRITEEATQFLGATKEGVTQWIDRPPLTALQQGVRYAVAAVDAQGHQARASGNCAQSKLVQVDLHDAWQLFAAGAMYHEQPGLWQTQQIARMQDANTLNATRAAFLQLDANTQTRAWQTFWQRHRTPTERIRWHHRWLDLMDPNQRQHFLQHPSFELPQAMQPWYRAAMWCEQHPAWADEPRRYFQLLTTDAQTEAGKRWREVIGFAHAQRFEQVWQTADSPERAVLARPLQQMVWFNSRDPQEQQQAYEMFAHLSLVEQQKQQQTWWSSLPAWLQEAVAWPDWEVLRPTERDAFLHTAPGAADPNAWPDALWPEFLAAVAWDNLPVTQKAEIMRQEVDPYHVWLSAFKAAIQPWDARLDFKLVTGFWLTVFGLSFGFILQKLRQYAQDHDEN